jgi:hypothetical protein
MIKQLNEALIELQHIEISFKLMLERGDENYTEEQLHCLHDGVEEAAKTLHITLMGFFDDQDNRLQRANREESKGWLLRDGHVERRLSLIQGGKQEQAR